MNSGIKPLFSSLILLLLSLLTRQHGDHKFNTRISLPATESSEILRDKSDFILELKARELISVKDDIDIHIVRVSDLTKPTYDSVYKEQDYNSDTYDI